MSDNFAADGTGSRASIIPRKSARVRIGRLVLDEAGHDESLQPFRRVIHDADGFLKERGSG